MTLERTHAEFPATSWTLVAGTPGETVESRLSRLIEVYWPAVYAYLRRSGHRREQAAELTQGFFCDVVIGRRLFDGADPARGRVRSLLVASLRHYLTDVARRQLARGDAARVPCEWLDREDHLLDDRRAATPEEQFDRRWALAQVEQAMRRCEDHFNATGKTGHWALFEARVVRPSLANVEPPPLESLASGLGFRSPADAAAAVQVVKKRFMALLRDVLAEQSGSAQDAEAEYRHCCEVLGRAPG